MRHLHNWLFLNFNRHMLIWSVSQEKVSLKFIFLMKSIQNSCSAIDDCFSPPSSKPTYLYSICTSVLFLFHYKSHEWFQLHEFLLFASTVHWQLAQLSSLSLTRPSAKREGGEREKDQLMRMREKGKETD